MFKRYRSAPWLVALYIAVSVAMPFLTTLTPSLAIAGISSGNIKTFLIYSGAAVTSQRQHHLSCKNPRLILAVYVAVILFCQLVYAAEAKAVFAEFTGNQLT